MESGITLQIDLRAIRRNVQKIKAFCPGAKVCAMVKANAYGHGLPPVALALEGIADFFGVARFSEAEALRRAGVTGGVLVCAGFEEERLLWAAENGISVTVGSLRELQICLSHTEKFERPLRIHIKCDTGMNRLGVKTDKEFSDMLELLKGRPSVCPEGVYTHFADCGDEPFTEEQFRIFGRRAEKAKYCFPGILAHCAGSAAIFSSKRYHMDMVRPGLYAYGYDVCRAEAFGVKLEPAMRAESSVLAVKALAVGESVGYSRAYTAPEDGFYAVISAGYGDGYNRLLSNAGIVDIGGLECGVIGNVCMDSFMARLPQGAAHTVKEGACAVLLRSGAGEAGLSFENAARLCRTIPYEILTSFTERCKRNYLN